VIKAGADLVVPDFSQWRALLGLLGVPAPRAGGPGGDSR
jgi:hypothetical protein